LYRRHDYYELPKLISRPNRSILPSNETSSEDPVADVEAWLEASSRLFKEPPECEKEVNLEKPGGQLEASTVLGEQLEASMVFVEAENIGEFHDEADGE
jgi:hypothetical protein